MSQAIQFRGARRGRFIVMLLATAATMVFLLLTQNSTAQAAVCEGGKVCVWKGTAYAGDEYNFGCGGATKAFFELHSAQNHCSLNVRIGWEEGGTTNWKACMGPSGFRPHPGRFNVVVPNGC
jgi:hypothetical protein